MNSVSAISENLLSVILLSYNSAFRIKNVFEDITHILELNKIPFELVIIDDGSEDNSYQIAITLEKEKKNVRAFQLSKNYTSFYAMFAGLSVCKGECAIAIPDDEQLPYQVIVDSYNLWKNGNKIIIPHRISRKDNPINNLFANSYYSIISALSEVNFPKGGADTFLIDREIIDIINKKIHTINTSAVAEILRLGFQPCFFPYERKTGSNNKTRWTLRKKIRLFKDTFFSSSTWPVKFITRIGLFFSLFAFAIIVFYSYIVLFGNIEFWGKQVPGWTSTVVIISFFSGIILFSLGIIAEYIWRIYEEVKNRPGYIIKKKENES